MKRKALDGLLKFRDLQEEVERSALAGASARFAVVNEAMSTAQNGLEIAQERTADALTTGDRNAWLVADADREISLWRMRRLEPLRKESLEAECVAMADFLKSRTQHEQVKTTVRRAERLMREESRRRDRKEADEFALRRRPLENL